jgi:ankyrin repeat protein
MIEAIQSNNIIQIQELIDVSTNKEELSNLLITSIQEGNIESSKLLITSNYVDINYLNDDDRTPLIESVCSSICSIELVNLLIEYNVEIDKCDSIGWSPVYYACDIGNFEVVNKLILEKCIVNKPNNFLFTPFLASCKNGNLDIIKLIWNSCKIDIDHKTTCGWTAIYISCYNGHFEVVSFLVNLNANVRISDKEGWEPFYICCKNGFYNITKFLIDSNKVEILCRTKLNITPLNAAIKRGHIDIVKLLVSLNADKEYIGNNDINNGCSSIFTAMGNGYLDIVKLLILEGADINIPNKDSVYPFYNACKNGYLPIIKYILELDDYKNNNEKVKKLVNQINKNNDTAFYAACSMDKLEVVKYLMSHEIEMNVERNNTDKNGYTPLSISIQKNYYEIIKVILEKKTNKFSFTDTNIADNIGRTPLLIAIEKYNNNKNKDKDNDEENNNVRNREIIFMLLSNYVDISIVGSSGKKILELIKYN